MCNERKDLADDCRFFLCTCAADLADNLGKNDSLALGSSEIGIAYASDSGVSYSLITAHVNITAGKQRILLRIFSVEPCHFTDIAVGRLHLGIGNSKIDTAEQIDDLNHTVEVYPRVVVNRDFIVILDCGHEKRASAISTSRIKFTNTVTGNLSIEITHERHHCDCLLRAVKGKQDVAVGIAVPAGISPIDSDQQKIVDILASDHVDTGCFDLRCNCLCQRTLILGSKTCVFDRGGQREIVCILSDLRVGNKVCPVVIRVHDHESRDEKYYKYRRDRSEDHKADMLFGFIVCQIVVIDVFIIFVIIRSFGFFVISDKSGRVILRMADSR